MPTATLIIINSLYEGGIYQKCPFNLDQWSAGDFQNIFLFIEEQVFFVTIVRARARQEELGYTWSTIQDVDGGTPCVSRPTFEEVDALNPGF